MARDDVGCIAAPDGPLAHCGRGHDAHQRSIARTSAPALDRDRRRLTADSAEVDGVTRADKETAHGSCRSNPNTEAGPRELERSAEHWIAETDAGSSAARRFAHRRPKRAAERTREHAGANCDTCYAITTATAS
jgi:hypothetical protein